MECFNRLPVVATSVDAAGAPGSAPEAEDDIATLAAAITHARDTLKQCATCIVSFSVTVMMEPQMFPRAG